MNNLIETLDYKGKQIQIFYDTEADSPNEWGNEDYFIVYDHRQFTVERTGFDPEQIYEHITESKKMTFDGYHVFPLYAYIHSGVSLSVSNLRYPFNCRFDVSTTGFVLIKRCKGSYRRDKAYKIAESVAKEWNTYLSGEVYGYSSDFGSCWGFYGDEGKEQMIEEAKGKIDYYLQEEQSKHFKQLKKWILNKVPLLNRKPLQLSF